MPEYVNEINQTTGVQQHPFLCVSCGHLLNNQNDPESVPNYQCLELYNEMTTTEDVIRFAYEGEKPILVIQGEDFKGFLGEVIKNPKIAKQFAMPLSIYEAHSGRQSYETTIPALTTEQLVQMARLLLDHGSNDAAQQLTTKLPEKYLVDSAHKPVVDKKTLYAASENGIIRNVYELTWSYPIYRCCPFCGAQIDCRAGAYPERRIGVIGTPRQGKSAVLTSTISSFLRENYHIKLIENTNDPQYQNFEKYYLNRYKKNISISKTNKDDTLAYRFTLELHGEKRNLLFVDIAGELLQERGRNDFLKRYSFFMANIDCFWMCTDDFLVRNLSEAPITHGLGSVQANQLYGGELDSMLKLLASDANKPSEKPLAVLLVKSDTLRPADFQNIYGSLKKRNDLYCYEEEGVLSEQEVYRLRTQLRQYIDCNNHSMVESFEKYFSNVGYLACSAYGHPVSKFNTAFGENMLLLYVHAEIADELFSDGKSYDVELHLGNRLSHDTQTKMLELHNFAPDCRVRTEKLRRSNDIRTFEAKAIRIPVCMKEGYEEGILRLLPHNPDRKEQWICGNEENNNDFFVQLPADNGVSISLVEQNSEINLSVVDEPKPDQVPLPLLWTLAMIGEYPTVGIVEVQKRFFWQNWFKKKQDEDPTERRKYKNDKQSRDVLCGKKQKHTSN